MVKIDRVYTRKGDAGRTRTATGQMVDKFSPRVETYGLVDEVNSFLGMARVEARGSGVLDAILERVQNDLFDLGADLATAGALTSGLRIQPIQVKRLEGEIDLLNARLEPLTSFILPGGSELAARLHVVRTTCRRAERAAAFCASQDPEVNPVALQYLNRLSDLMFVAARYVNQVAAGDVLWIPHANAS